MSNFMYSHIYSKNKNFVMSVYKVVSSSTQRARGSPMPRLATFITSKDICIHNLYYFVEILHLVASASHLSSCIFRVMIHW